MKCRSAIKSKSFQSAFTLMVAFSQFFAFKVIWNNCYVLITIPDSLNITVDLSRLSICDDLKIHFNFGFGFGFILVFDRVVCLTLVNRKK
jgi:hypothetical protein